MGLFEKILDKCTEQVNQKSKKKGILERIYEACTEPVETKEKEYGDIEKEPEERDISFVDVKSAEQLYQSIKGKIQLKKKELKTIGQSLTLVDLKDIKQNKEELIKEIINDYIKLCKQLEELVSQQERTENSDATQKMEMKNVFDIMNLQTSYEEFEIQYKQKSELINNLYWLNELKKQNRKMKKDFTSKKYDDISDEKIENYRKYIQTISAQRENFTYKLGDEIIDELVIAEYRLRMLTLMKDVNSGKEIDTNPFAKESKSKKVRYEELLLEDLEEASDQYEQIEKKKEKFIDTDLIEKKEFKKLKSLTQEIQEDIDLAVVDDLSISEVFTTEGFNTIKNFVKLRAKINSIIHQSTERNHKKHLATLNMLRKQTECDNKDSIFLWDLSRKNIDDIDDEYDY